MPNYNRIAYIYRIICLVTNKCYIGQTINLDSRKWEHYWSLRKGTHHNKYLQAVFNKYGEENFVFEILEIVELPEDFETNKQGYRNFLVPYEQKWIDYYGSANSEYGYNLCPVAGTTLGFKHTDETKKRKSESTKGKPHSEEHTKKVSESLRGHIVTPETRQKIGDSKKGKPALNRGIPRTDNEKKKMSDAKKGKPGFPGFKGKTHTPEELLKISKGVKEAYKKKKGLE